MSLRTHLFLVFGTLMGLLVAAEWALVTALTRDLEREVHEIAFRTGSEVLGSILPRVEETEEENERHVTVEQGEKGHSRAFVVRPSALHRPGLARLFRSQAGHLRALRELRLHPTGVLDLEEADRRRDRRTVRLPEPEDLPDAESMMVVQMTLSDERTDRIVGLGRRSIHLRLAQGADVEVEVEDDLAASLEKLEDLQLDGVLQKAAPAPPEDEGPMSVEIPIPSQGIEAARRAWLRRLLLGSAAILGLGLLLTGWVAHRVTRPLRELSSAANRLGDGALGTQADHGGDREVGDAIQAFNHMSVRLAELDAEAQGLRRREHLTEIGEVARGLAHAMRNPLHLLGMSVSELAARGDGESAELAASARGQIQRIDRSLRSFLALSSGGAGAVEEVAVDDLARDVALELLQQEPGGVRVEIEGPERCTVRGVAAELRALVHVLVVNAVEASAPGEEVRVAVRCERGGVDVEVADRGPGLAPEVRERLFTPHLTTKEQGAGMGLFLAHRIATSRYGGSLALEERPGGGTRAVLSVGDRGGDRA